MLLRNSKWDVSMKPEFLYREIHVYCTIIIRYMVTLYNVIRYYVTLYNVIRYRVTLYNVIRYMVILYNVIRYMVMLYYDNTI